MEQQIVSNPVTPYAGTGGWSGTATSAARAYHEVSSGKLTERQIKALGVLSRFPQGLIWSELADQLGLHHGQASSVLSNLHSAGLVFQLTKPRNRCLPYVHRDFEGRYEPSERRDYPDRTASNTKENLRNAKELLVEATVLLEDFGMFGADLAARITEFLASNE